MSARTRSTARPRRVEVERMSAPQAEMSTAGVIIAVRTATAEVKASIFTVEGETSRRRLWTRAARAGKRPQARGGRRRFLWARLKVVVRSNQSCVILRRKADKRSLAALIRLGTTSPARGVTHLSQRSRA